MPIIPVRLACALVFALCAAIQPATAAERLVTRESKFPVKETMDRLATALEAKGVKVAARIDHAAGAKAAGLDMPPTEVIMFGNPKLGTPLMLANRHIGIDLPMRVLAWQDAKGKTWIAYTAPKALKTRHGIKGQDATIAALTAAVDSFAAAAAMGN